MLVKKEKKKRHSARPLRFSYVVMWRDVNVRSLCRFAFCFVIGGMLISPSSPIHSQIFLANSFGLNLDEICIFVRSDRIFRSRHRISVFSVHLTDPPFCLSHLTAKEETHYSAELLHDRRSITGWFRQCPAYLLCFIET